MNGPKAFPGPVFTRHGMQNGHDMGMALRDWFAGQVMAQMIARPEWAELGLRERAEGAYRAADAMLAAREKG